MILLRGLRFLTVLGVLGAIGFFLVSYPGTAKIDWFDYSVTVPVGFLITIALLFCVAGGYSIVAWKALWSLPKRYRERIERKRSRKGRDLLIDGLSAIAAGQNNEAKEIMSIASELIPDDALTKLIAAGTAYATGDEENATRRYLALIKNKRTGFLGFRGLLIQAKERGDNNLAQEYIEKALLLRPDSPWLQNEYLVNAVRLAKKGVFLDVEKNKLGKYVAKPLWQRHKAMIYWLKAQNDLSLDYQEKERLRLKIVELAPDWVYNVKLLVELYMKYDYLSKAQKIIQEAFKKTPHRILGELWDLVFNELRPVDRYRAMEKLVNGNEAHPESQFLLAESAIKAQLWGQAEKHLDNFLSDGLTGTGCGLMAELTEKRYPDRFDLAREWWSRAARINTDYVWQCGKCHTSTDEWHLVCDTCQEIDRIYWGQNSKPRFFEREEFEPETPRLTGVV